MDVQILRVVQSWSNQAWLVLLLDLYLDYVQELMSLSFGSFGNQLLQECCECSFSVAEVGTLSAPHLLVAE